MENMNKLCKAGILSSLLESMLLDDVLIMRLHDTARLLAPNLLVNDQLLKKTPLKLSPDVLTCYHYTSYK